MRIWIHTSDSRIQIREAQKHENPALLDPDPQLKRTVYGGVSRTGIVIPSVTTLPRVQQCWTLGWTNIFHGDTGGKLAPVSTTPAVNL